MKIVKKLLALVMVLVTLINILPSIAFASENTDETYYLEAVRDTTVRETPYEKGEVLDDVKKGELLYCIGTITNKYDNVWHKVVCDDGYGYIYCERVQLHACEWQTVSYQDFTVHYCRCGALDVEQKGMTQQGAPVALNPVLDGDAIQDLLALGSLAASQLSSLGGSLVTALTNPYVMVPVIVGGIILYAVVTYDSTAFEIRELVNDMDDFDPDQFERGKYYYAALVGKHFVFYPDTALSLDEAKEFMMLYADSLSEVSTLLREVRLGSLYTPYSGDALALCRELEATGRFGYGDSEDANINCEINTYRHSGEAYIMHYHLYAKITDKILRPRFEKICDAHIFFGLAYMGGEKYI